MNARKPTHPGEVLLEDVIKPLGLTITTAARTLGVSRKTLSRTCARSMRLKPQYGSTAGKSHKNQPGKLAHDAKQT